MQQQEFEVKGKDGVKLYGRSWAPDREMKAAVCLVHGLGEHIGRYEHVAEYLVKEGYGLFGFDLRGHGKSEGKRGYIPHYEVLLDDIGQFLEEIGKLLPDLPRYLYGHSLGGNLVINYGLRRKPALRGVVATGPALRLAFEPPRLKVVLGRWMNVLYPGLIMASGLEVEALSRDPKVVTAYQNDPLVHDRVSPRLFVGLYDGGLWALEHASEFPLPLLLMHGGEDRITSPQASREFAERMGERCWIKIWEGLYHEIHNEPEKEEVLGFMVQWLNQPK